MEVNTINRRDIGFTIISRFEELFRTFILTKLPLYFGNYNDGIPSGILQKASERSMHDTIDLTEIVDNLDFPDIKEILIYKNMFSQYFSRPSISRPDFERLMNSLYQLRCKIAHVKGYFTSFDLDSLKESSLMTVSLLEDSANEYKEYMRSLEESPESFTLSIPIGFLTTEEDKLSIPHNIPTPDYEYEGGFVGRDEDIKKLIALITGDLHRVITISGAGGVGKSALALKIIQEILEKHEEVFDGVVWLSAKENKLSFVGIEDIDPTVKTYEELLDTIFEVMGFGNPSDTIEKKEKDVETVFELHNKILIVIDNLETITDERIINFILDAHSKMKILITSRKGLGQVERRYELKQLNEKEAVYLFRLIAKDKNLTGLVKQEDKIIKEYVKRVSCYPLAIKWLIGHVAIGKDINTIIDTINETTSDISNFCFDQIYNELSKPSKKILCALSCFDEAPSAGVLVYAVDINQIEFEDGIQELILVSLVIPEQYKNEQNEIASRYTLLSLTRGYVRKQLDRDSILKRDIDERLKTIQSTIEEADRAKKQYKYSLANLGASTEEEKVAAMIAQTAFQKYQAGRYIDAVEDYKRAISIAPRFGSIYRNWAVMESNEGHSVEADKLMEKASKLNSKDPQIWLTWGNMKKKESKIKDAFKYYEIAYDLSPNDHIILNSLGQAKCRLGEYSEADKLFKEALNAEYKDTSIRHEIINRSGIADNLRRWAESLKRDRNHKEAEAKLLDALVHSNRVRSLDESDRKSNELHRDILIELGFLYKNSNPELAVEYFTEAIVDKPLHFKEAKDTLIASLQCAIIYHRMNNLVKAREVFSHKLRKLREPLKRDLKLQERFNEMWSELYLEHEKVQGTIIRVDFDKRFVIIELSNSPGATYLGRFSNFIPPVDGFNTELNGRQLSFHPKEMIEGKESRGAKFIKLL